MTRYRQTDRRTDRQTSAPFHDMATHSGPHNKFQRVQSCLARVELQHNYDSATSLLSELHWLPVNKQINFKITTLVYQSLAFGQPTYLSSVLTPHQPQWSLRSVNQNLLSVPRCNSSFGQRTFPTVALESETTYHCNASLVYWHIWPNVLRNWSIYHTRSSWSKEQSFDQMHSTFGQTRHIVPGPTEQLLCYSVDY